MPQAKTLVKALQPFAHGNVNAQAGRTYAMNSADAKDLIKAGFGEEVKDGEAEQTQNDEPKQKKQPGDVVVDDAEDVLGDGKQAPAPENKMEQPARNKSTAAKK